MLNYCRLLLVTIYIFMVNRWLLKASLGGGDMQSHFHVQSNFSVEVVLRLCCVVIWVWVVTKMSEKINNFLRRGGLYPFTGNSAAWQNMIHKQELRSYTLLPLYLFSKGRSSALGCQNKWMPLCQPIRNLGLWKICYTGRQADTQPQIRERTHIMKSW